MVVKTFATGENSSLTFYTDCFFWNFLPASFLLHSLFIAVLLVPHLRGASRPVKPGSLRSFYLSCGHLPLSLSTLISLQWWRHNRSFALAWMLQRRMWSSSHALSSFSQMWVCVWNITITIKTMSSNNAWTAKFKVQKLQFAVFWKKYLKTTFVQRQNNYV